MLRGTKQSGVGKESPVRTEKRKVSKIRLVAETRRLMHTRFFVDRSSDHRASVVLAGTGRSGTTWISDVINYQNDYRMIFEPFRPSVVKICGHFNQIQYLRPDSKDKAYVEPVTVILSGRLRNAWADRFNKRFVSNRRLIKTIRANLFLKWIHVNFPGVQIAILLRHPCAVALSQRKLDWKLDLDRIFLTQEALMEDFLDPFREDIKRAKSAFEKHILLWCIDTYIPLKQFRNGEIHLGFYENFCVNPEEEVRKLFSYLGREYDHRILSYLKRPSALSREDSAIVTGKSRIESWRESITDEELEIADKTLRRFRLHKLYSVNSLMPDLDSAYDLMGQARPLGGRV